jgi:hypothetical protein
MGLKQVPTVCYYILGRGGRKLESMHVFSPTFTELSGSDVIVSNIEVTPLVELTIY